MHDPTSPFEVAAKVQQDFEGNDYELRDAMVCGILSMPNVIVLDSPEGELGIVQARAVARTIFPMFDAMGEEFQQSAVNVARAAIQALAEASRFGVYPREDVFANR